jgi:hypothetical protein
MENKNRRVREAIIAGFLWVRRARRKAALLRGPECS